MDFHLPYFMVFFMVGMHILFLLMVSEFQNGISNLDNQYKFFSAFDSTIMKSLKINIGRNRVKNLQDLWIKGFG